MQRGEALGDREIGTQDVAKVDPLSGQVVDSTPVEPKPEDQADPLTGMPEDTAAWRLQQLNVEASCTAEMPRSLVVARIREASYGMDPAPTEDDIQAEADRIWTSFGDNRKGPAERKPDWRDVVRDRVVDVGPDGIVENVREPEKTPDRGPDVGTTHHTVTDEEPRFSGGGIVDGPTSNKIPTDAQFNGKAYLEAPELANIAEELIGRHGFLEDHENCVIRWYWKRKTGVSKGRVTIGMMKRASDLLGHLTGADFIGYLSATTLRNAGFTDQQIEAAVFHELLHIGSDDKGNFISVPHDFEGFAAEVRVYGTWTESLKLGGQAFSVATQLGLDLDGAAGCDDDEDEEGLAEEMADRQAEYDADDAALDKPGGTRDWTEEDDAQHEGEYEASMYDEPDTAGELPTGDEIDASRPDEDPLADPAVI